MGEEDKRFSTEGGSAYGMTSYHSVISKYQQRANERTGLPGRPFASLGVLYILCPPVTPGKPDNSIQMKGAEHVNCSFDM